MLYSVIGYGLFFFLPCIVIIIISVALVFIFIIKRKDRLPEIRKLLSFLYFDNFILQSRKTFAFKHIMSLCSDSLHSCQYSWQSAFPS